MKFEEQFPSLKDRRILQLDGILKYDIIPTKYIQEHCLDKNKVKKIIEETIINHPIGKENNFPKEFEARVEAEKDYARELKKKLGLDK